MEDKERVELLIRYLEQLGRIESFVVSEPLAESIKKATNEIEKILIK